MESLVQNILSLENQANDLLEKARADAREHEKSAADKIAEIQQEISAQVESRVADFRAKAEQQHQEDVAQAQAESQRALAAVDHIGQEVIARHVDSVVARYLEL
jgi:F0F1-type ATP synthase membrane subunit b/b'